MLRLAFRAVARSVAAPALAAPAFTSAAAAPTVFARAAAAAPFARAFSADAAEKAVPSTLDAGYVFPEPIRAEDEEGSTEGMPIIGFAPFPEGSDKTKEVFFRQQRWFRQLKEAWKETEDFKAPLDWEKMEGEEGEKAIVDYTMQKYEIMSDLGIPSHEERILMAYRAAHEKFETAREYFQWCDQYRKELGVDDFTGFYKNTFAAIDEIEAELGMALRQDNDDGMDALHELLEPVREAEDFEEDWETDEAEQDDIWTARLQATVECVTKMEEARDDFIAELQASEMEDPAALETKASAAH